MTEKTIKSIKSELCWSQFAKTDAQKVCGMGTNKLKNFFSSKA